MPEFEPIQPVALIEAGVDQGKAGAQEQHASPIGVGEQLAIDAFAGRAQPYQQRHEHGDHRVLPIEPLPAEVLHVEAHERHADVVREGQSEGVGREAGNPPPHRQIVKDDHDRRRDEDAQQQSMNEVQGQEQLVIANEGNDDRRDGIDQGRPNEHTAHAKCRGEQGNCRGDENLRRGRRRAQPGPLVEGQPEGASEIRQAYREQPRVEARDEGTEQHCADGRQWIVGRAADGDGAAADGFGRHASLPVAWMRVTTDIPGRSCSTNGWPGSNSIRTGMRCTTLVKFPVALSGGSRAKVDPLAGRDAPRGHEGPCRGTCRR
jgi:hypothetical protein